MKPVDMARSKAERKKSMDTCAVGIESEGPDYPYGLELRLENDSLDKLGMSSLPKVGKKVSITATGVVTSVSQNESSKGNGHANRSVSVQIQKLAVSTDAASAMDAMDEGIDEAE
jgi:hypothetical protein